MKVIFLDIDGVLNTQETFIEIHKVWKETGLRVPPIDKDMIKNLKELVEETKAKIVLTSSWKSYFDDNMIALNKEGEDFLEVFYENNLYIYDKLRKPSHYRGSEILEYLKDNPIESFVILDDETFNYEELNIIDKLVQTSFMKGGFTKDHKDIAIKKLTKKD